MCSVAISLCWILFAHILADCIFNHLATLKEKVDHINSVKFDQQITVCSQKMESLSL